MKTFLATLLLGLAMTTAARAATGPVVLELFTSQGCSSCPPADALLQTLAQDPQVLALSFHVDYWDNGSWRDPFSRSESTARQYAYGKTLNQNGVYTPELVVDGAQGMVGSHRSDVEDALATAKTRNKPVTVTITADAGRNLTINLQASTKSSAADVWLIGYSPEAVTAVRGGENGGRNLTSINNVASISRIGQLQDATMRLTVPAPGTDHYAVLVQSISDGKIIGAGKL